MKMEKTGNILQPVFDAVWEAGKVGLSALPFLWDRWGNFCYWLVEGVQYGTVVIEEDDEIQTENIRKYEYIATVDFEEITKEIKTVTYKYIEGEKGGVKACVGHSIEFISNKWFDMLEGHTIVGGASRWGKSSFLNTFITSIMLTYTENEVMFLGCDYKKSDVYFYRKYKHFRGMATNKKEFLSLIKGLEKEMDKRANILEEANCRNVIKYNKVSENKLGYIIFVIDELIQLTTDNECSEILHTIMSKCASYGIYFILASQDLTKQVVGRCKMNCSQIVGFHTFDSTDSETLIGKGYNLQDITVKGRCKIKNSEGVEETQIFFIEEEEIESLLKPFEKEAK